MGSTVPTRAVEFVERGAPATVVFALLVAGWQTAVVVSDLPTVILPAPATVLSTGIEAWPRLLEATVVSAATAGLGLSAGIAVGLSLAFLMVVSPGARAIVQPYLVALRIAPLVAVAPLVFLWAGSGLPSRALLVTTLTVFPVALGGLDGLRSTPTAYLELMRSVDASATATFLHVRVPAALPSVLAGVKLAAALSVIGTVVAEFLTLRAGLGYQVFTAADALDTALMFAALFALVALGLAFYLAAAGLERVLGPAGGTR
ncbi:NitT/TauT family transport system permease protein [Halogranum amylolyticum]|uniref:NitT/TauT family transport system permease protein n=1 Tax=Halogranum amylolyticum TaxID=660520 RepID=A0A1H8TIR0_9EURY|nr:ABC transporter permease [Halogranum amylolyticum]SEO90705.1 NitT/TauT family transport system permease protein [Halogranum amylolyticum]